MAITNNDLVKFGYGVAANASTAAGHISFASDTRQLFVGDGTDAIAFAGNVANAVFADKKLTITYNDGTETAVLDFSDVASAEGVSSLLGGLRKDVEANKTSISNLSSAVDTSIKALDVAYKAADASLKEAYEAADQAINTKIGTVAEGKTVVGLIEEAKAAANAAHSVVAKDSSFLTLNTSTAENGAITYTLGTSDIASATELASVSAVAEAAQTAEEVSTAISNAIDALGGSADDVDDSSFVKVAVTSEKGEVKNVTVTTTNIAKASDLNDVSTRLDSFLNGEGLADTVDTLKDIQAWINGDGVNATELTQAIADEAALRELADSSIRTDFAAADTGLSNRIKAVEDDYLKASDKTELSNIISGVSAVANAAAVKTTTDASLALKADASVVYTKSETYTKTEVNNLVDGANTNASTAESNAKAYADAITVNGQTQSDQEITLTGLNIKVGGTGSHKEDNIDAAIEDLYTEVGKAQNAGVQSLSVNANSSNYAEVNESTGAVTLTIKKVALADASDSNTGVADANDVKKSIATAKSEAILAVQGDEGDAPTAATVAGAKAYADAQIEAAALRWSLL